MVYLDDGLHVALDELVLEHGHDAGLRGLVEVVSRALRLLADARLHARYVHRRAVLAQKLLRFHLCTHKHDTLDILSMLDTERY